MADAAATAGAGGSGTRSGSKQSTNPADNYHLARRRTLQVVVSSLLTEAGFESAEKASVETLTEMLQSYISEIGRSAKSYCEHTARTQPTLSDIVVTLVEMGFNVDTLPAYAKRSQRMVITAPPVTNQPVTPKALTAGQNRPHPPHIPSHFPEFPDPHTYIKTPEDSGAEKENTSVLQQNPSLSGSRNGEENIIDNPYLRPVKKPKIRRKNRHGILLCCPGWS
ncbi:transcription initiation factor TFIID subunit 8 isoform 6 [Homo sapiens]|uniref:transcription initiation factor TFIID subunit 8 isoform 6 n=1 Tax=Homo sapiens TaxID=9606 RepID=UPI0007DC8225|nr:transcription initiation factor TFIID subunit 8 isoform X3 [Homo sapiens]XP_054210185.1 transcription initiation factor TFIID subunit 8 isoform X3 [Homo sapiens]|eukprot:XP_016865733.1 transcription initiation factor TFIID subunit 8 isoform X5 [Homo sapiens]